MKGGKNYAGFNNPFLIWADLAIGAGELMMASAVVIACRTHRMNAAGATPNARDRRELNVMQQEKIKAAGQSAQAMAKHMLTLDPLLGMRVYRQMLTGAAAMLSLPTSRTLDQLVRHQATLLRSMAQSADSVAELCCSSAHLAQRGLKPIHARATANAKRLTVRT